MIWPESIRVAGIKHHLGDVDVETVAEIVKLEREPNNPVHGRAIAIYGMVGSPSLQVKLGYVPKLLADMVNDKQLPTNGRVVWKRGQPKPGIRIQA